MILLKTIWNNGFGCPCCMYNYTKTAWIEESDMLSPKQILKMIKKNRKHMGEDHIVDYIYEKDGKVLYGFTSRIYGFMVGEDTFLLLGDEKYLYKSSISERRPQITKKEFIDHITSRQELKGKQIC